MLCKILFDKCTIFRAIGSHLFVLNHSLVKVTPEQAMKAQRGEYRSVCLTSVQGGSGWIMPCPSCFTLLKDPVPIVKEARWTPGQVWTGMEKHYPTESRSVGHLAHSKSLYPPFFK
jgi:hypothetical protein